MPVPPGRFGAVLTAMITPFDDEGAIDLDGAQRLARWLVDNGSDGLVVAGSTGESGALSDEEKADLFAAVAEAVTVPVLAGTSTSDTAHSVAVTRAAEAAGVDAILAVTPYYSRPSQAGIEAHFRALAEATSLPVVLYDIAIRSGRRIEESTMLRLAREVPNIVAVKDASADPARTAAILAQAPGFEAYSGDDVLTLPLLAVGAVGVISVASHWTGTLQGQMVSSFAKGDVEEAQHLHARLIPSFRFETSEEAPNPIPTKAVMRVLGLPAGQCRLPMGPAPEGLEDQARSILADLGADAPRG
ncbi:MAG: 4-hydroxy-tetrahydrodipicolinate synthase [Acidimicrobiaceae bacterium]|jgi:4-hydroxy-tetrahydrodipicolinate synthase|nr:4-hydroxy-tetrahydrodipicolinate synthase [Acidimicrobiaceae bacterium]